MSHPEERALFHAICAEPHEDAPRLVYADWLEEHGDELDQFRAEFIRVQIEQTRLDAFDPRQGDLADRNRLLHVRFGDGWQRDVHDDVRFYAGSFRRGFVARLERTTQEYLQQPERWDAITPVEGIWFRESEDSGAVLACPHLARLRYANLMLGRGGFRALPDCPHLGRMEHLILGDERGVRPGDMERLAAATMPRLEKLEVKFSNLTGEDICTLLRSPGLPRLERLDVCYNRTIGTDGLRIMAALPEFSRMRVINLQGIFSGQASVQNLCDSPNAGGLRELHLACCELGDEGVATIANARHLANLAQLWMYSNGIGAAGVAALAHSPHLRLSVLSLTGNDLGVEGARAMSAGDALSGLRDLSLSGANIGDEGVQALADCPALAGLTHLDLMGNNLTSAAARALADSPYLTNLRSLRLVNNKLRNDGITALARSANFRHLRELDLRNNEMRLNGTRALAASPYLSNLQRLDLEGNPIGGKGAMALAESPHLPSGPMFLIHIGERTGIGQKGSQALRDRWGDGIL